MKKSISYFIFLLCVFIAGFTGFSNAQKKPRIENLPKYDLRPYHFGFALCINQMNFAIHPNIDYKSDTLLVLQSTPQWGFNIGIVSNLRLNEYSDLRFLPTLSFGERILDYTLKDSANTAKNDMVHKKIESTFIDFPFLIKYKSKRLNDVRAYLIAGGQFSIDLASQAKKKDRNKSLVKLKQNDIICEIGVGFDFYLEYFKFSTELKMMYGLRDLLKRDNTLYTNSIDRLNSKIFQLSFLFE